MAVKSLKKASKTVKKESNSSECELCGEIIDDGSLCEEHAQCASCGDEWEVKEAKESKKTGDGRVCLVCYDDSYSDEETIADDDDEENEDEENRDADEQSEDDSARGIVDEEEDDDFVSYEEDEDQESDDDDY